MESRDGRARARLASDVARAAVAWPRAKGRAEPSRAVIAARVRGSSREQIWLPHGRTIMRSGRAAVGSDRVRVRVRCCWRAGLRRRGSTAGIMGKAVPNPRPVSAILARSPRAILSRSILYVRTCMCTYACTYIHMCEWYVCVCVCLSLSLSRPPRLLVSRPPCWPAARDIDRVYKHISWSDAQQRSRDKSEIRLGRKRKIQNSSGAQCRRLSRASRIFPDVAWPSLSYR